MKKIQAIKLINREGFTLVELMVTVLLFSGIIALIYSTLVLGNYSWQVSRNNIFLQQEARRALISMVKELRSAENVSVSQSDQIDFSVDGIGDIQYTLESNQITRKDPTTGLSPDGRSIILANSISNLSFTLDLDTDAVVINITAVTTTLQGNALNFNLNGRVRFRNS